MTDNHDDDRDKNTGNNPRKPEGDHDDEHAVRVDRPRRPRVDADHAVGEEVAREDEVGDHHKVSGMATQRQLEQSGVVEGDERHHEQTGGNGRVTEQAQQRRVHDEQEPLARAH